MNRPMALMLLIPLNACAVLADEPNPASGARDQARHALATRAAAQEILALLHAEDEPLESERAESSRQLAEAMAGDMATWRSPQASANRALDWLKDWHREKLLKQADAALARAQAQSPLPLDRTEVLRRADEDWDGASLRRAEQAARGDRDAVFAAARERAIERGRELILQQRGSPPFETLDARISDLDAVRGGAVRELSAEEMRTLAPWLAEFAAKPEVVFDELRPWILDLGGHFAEQLHAQYRAQAGHLAEWMGKDKFPTALFLREPMQAILDGALARNVRPDASAQPPVYPVFSAVRALARDVAAHWEGERFIRFLRDSGALRIRPEAVEKLLRGELPLHVKAAESHERAATHFLDALRMPSVRAYADTAPEADRPAVGSRFEREWGGPGPVASACRTLIGQQLSDLLPRLRSAMAEEQVKAHFPRIHKGEPLPEPLVLAAHQRGWQRVDSLKDLLEVLESPPEWMPKDFRSEAFFEDAAAQVVERVNRQMAPALASLRTQLRLVESLESDWLDQLARDVQAGLPFDRILRAWESEWERRWGQESGAIAAEWRRRFGRTGDQLSKTVRQLYDAQRETISSSAPSSALREASEGQSDQAASEEIITVDRPETEVGDVQEMDEKEGEGAGAEPLSGMKEQLARFRGVADGVLAFRDRPDGTCSLVFGSPSGQGAIEVDFDPSDIEASARLIAERLREPLRAVLDGHPGATQRGGFFFRRERELKMLFDVESPLIRHRMSIRLRGLLQDEIRAWSKESGKDAPRLLWQDEIGP